jgi:hypothetical protein
MVTALMHQRRFTSVDENQSFVVFDEPRMNRNPIGPLAIDQHVAEARDAASATGHLRDFDANRSGADCMNPAHAHQCVPSGAVVV